MTIGQSIREARKSKGLTQRKLEVEAGVSQGALSNWEKDIYSPSIFNLICLADVLSVSLDELVGRTPPKGGVG